MHIQKNGLYIALLVGLNGLFSSQLVQGFGWGSGNKVSKVSVSDATVEEALAVYEKKFQLADGKRKPFKPFFTQWGIPEKDIDGSKVKKEYANQKRMVDQSVDTQKANFLEIARIYGEDEALQMVKDLPYVLAFKKSNFAENYKVYEEIFGEEPAKAMVQRNPGLLAIKAEDAARNTNEQTMVFSYLVGFFRPISGIAGPLLIFLLSTPALEQVTGIPIRTSLLAFVTNSSPLEAAQTLQSIADPLGVL